MSTTEIIMPSTTTYKGKLTNRSWQQLPPELVRLIITHSLLDVSATGFLPRTWDHREQWLNRMVFTVIRDAELIEQFMSVCPAWHVALETHLYWQHAISVLDPHDAVLHLSRVPIRLTPYNHFRYNIVTRCCVPCRINSPQTTDGFFQVKRQIYTLGLGVIPACREHKKERICGICVRDFVTDDSVMENEDLDTWPQLEATCRQCRAEWLWRACDTPRLREAVGGRMFAAADWETRQACDSFIALSEGTIRDVLALAQDKFWLRKNTKLAEIMSQAMAASRLPNRDIAAGFESEEEEEEDYSDEEDPELMSITEDAGGVRDIAMTDWARSRIMSGQWCSPADQWHAIHTQGFIFPQESVEAVHPCPWILSSEDVAAHETRFQSGNLLLRSEVPPSYSLCETAYDAYRKQMHSVLHPAVKNIVQKIAIESAADGVDPCIRAARMSVEDVVGELRDESVWYKGVDWLQRRTNAMLERREKARVIKERENREREEAGKNSSGQQGQRKEDSDDSSSSSKSDGSHTTSPVLSTSTIQTTPSPPPLGLKKDVGVVSPMSLSLSVEVDAILESPVLIPSIPYVPVSMNNMPPFTIDTVKSIWRDACAPLFHCRCSICERAVLKANVEAGHFVPSQQQQPVASPTLQQVQEPPVQIHLQEATPITVTRTTGHKRSSHDLEVDFDPTKTEIQRLGTPPKRARTDEHERSVSSSPGNMVAHKRSSEELDDIELLRDDNGKRARKESGVLSPPISLSVSLSASPSEEVGFMSGVEDLYVMDESDLDAEGDLVEAANER